MRAPWKTPSLLLLSLVGCATSPPQRPTLSSLDAGVRAWAYREQPTLNPQSTFALEEYEIQGLWQKHAVRLLRVTYRAPDRSPFQERLLISQGESLLPLVETFGGDGLLSAALMEDGLYFSNSWGSGLHRCQLGRLSFRDGGNEILLSAEVSGQDLFVRADGGRVQVEAGRFEGFNRWRPLGFVGWLKTDPSDDLSLTVVDAAGKRVQQSNRGPQGAKRSPH